MLTTKSHCLLSGWDAAWTKKVQFLAVALLLGSLGASGTAARAAGNDPAPVTTGRPAAQKWTTLYRSSPLSFEVNRGQAAGEVKYLARGQGYTLYLTGEEAVLTLQKAPAASPQPSADGNSKLTARIPAVLRLQLMGAKAAAVEGEEALPGESNYFVGNEPSRWQTHVPTYAKVRYRGVYGGVDVVYYGRQGQLENDFEVAAGADAGQIELQVEGAEGLAVDGAGDLVLQVAGEEVRWHRPVAYQGSGESRRQVEARYEVRGRNRIGFAVGAYDGGQALVIDPVLSYATYLGGTGGDVAYGIAVDASGNAYVTGITNSNGFPTQNAGQPSYGGSGDAFVTKLNATGTALVYSTFLGGAGSDSGTAIAVDASGDAFVTGTTSSANFPTTLNAFQAAFGGNSDAFITQLNSAGSNLVYSSYLGGSGADFGQGVAVDTTGNAYVTGSTQSGDFTLVNPIQNVNKGGSDVFVAKVNFDGTALIYSTYLGGTGSDVGQNIKVDSSGSAYVAGYTFSTDFPTLNAIQNTNFGRVDAFVAEVNAAGSALTFSTYLGGGGDDKAYGLALDGPKNIYVTGMTQSADFPTTSTAYQLVNNGQGDAFICKLGPAGAGVIYSTLLGGSGVDQGNSIAVDSSGDAFVTGTTQSSDFPKANPLQAILGITGGGSCGAGTCSDAFVTELNPNGSGLTYSTYLGGTNAEFGQGIALDTSGSPYITGSTSSANFPVIVGAYQGALAGMAGNAFVAKIDPSSAPGMSIVPSKVNFGNQTLGVRSAAQTVTVINAGTLPLSITDISSSSTDFAQVNNCVGSIAAGGGTCTLNVTFTPSTLTAVTAQITFTDDAAGNPHVLTVTGTGVSAATAVTVSPANLSFGNQTVGTVSSPPKDVTITNTGTQVLNITQISVSGDFNQTNTCGATLNLLNVGESCVVSVTFAPAASGARSGSLGIADNAAGSPQIVALAGTGVAEFSVGATNTTNTVVIGSTTTTYTVSTTAPGSFTGSISFSCSPGITCTFNPASVVAGQSTTVTVSGLTASMANPFNFYVNGISGSQATSVALSLLFSDYKLTATPGLNTIPSGSPAHYTVAVTPSNGFNQRVDLSCSNLPTGATCTFDNASVTPNGSPVNAALTINTTKRVASLPPQRWPFGGAPSPWVGITGLLVLGSLMLLHRRVQRRTGSLGFGSRRARLLALGTALGLALLFAACRNANTVVSGGTPTGNYTITITGKLNSNSSVTRTTTLNLSVQ